jgi:hypothetical protein
MKPTSMLDIERQEAIKFIRLPFFLDALEFSPLTRGSNPKEVFFMLLDEGLPLRFSEPDYCFDDEKIHKSDVKCALIRIEKKLETEIPRMKHFTQEVITSEAGNKTTMASILIGREDVRRLYAKLGFDLYPWVKIPWPIDASDFEDCPTKANFSEKYQTQFGRSFWDDEAEHDDEFSTAFEVLNNPNLAEIGFCKDDVIALLKKNPSDALLVERQNAAAEIAAMRPNFSAEYKVKSSDLIRYLPPLPENPTFEERAKRFIWINVLNKRKNKVDAEAPSEARTKELEQLNQTIEEIQRQLRYPKNKSQLGNLPPELQPKDAQGTGKSKNESDQTKEWKVIAREIGERWMNEERKKGGDPGVIAIAKYVEGEMSTKMIIGPRGKFLDWETIKREALTGITGRPANGKRQKS